MPTVPRYDSFQATPTTQPQARFDAPQMVDTAGRQAQQTGQALLSAGGQVGQVALDMQNDANKVRIDDATNQAVKLDTDLRAEMLQLQGKNALERPDGMSLADEYGKKLKDGIDQITQGLGNDAQKQAFGHVASDISSRLYSLASGHMVKQQEAYQKDVWATTIETARDRAVLLWADTNERANALGAIRATTNAMAKKYGMDKDSADRAYTEAASPLHVGVIKAMITADHADQAQQYYQDNSADMTLQARAQVQTQIADASSSQQAETGADEVWAKLGPKDATDPVRQFDMEQQLREQFKDSPDTLKKAIAGLRERSAAFNAQQGEIRAGGINDVWGMIDAGAGMRTVRNSQAWLNMPEKDRHDIMKTLESEAAVRSSRAASESSRALTEMQRTEKLNFMRNGDLYLTQSDPTVLSKMSRGQVEAKRSQFGMEATQHLLNRWDDLQKPGKIAEAKMDKQDFDQIADSLGLQPFARNLDEDKKRALGSLQYRVEQLIDMKQRSEKRTLTRDEKSVLMKQEMAKQVTVEGGWFSSDKQVPVVQLSPEQLKDVVVPSDERAQIVDALKSAYQKNPANPAYAPTEDNIRRLYVRRVSPAGNLIPNAQ